MKNNISKKEKVVLVMGSFNPITNAHVELGRVASMILPNAEVVYVPSNLEYNGAWKSVDTLILTDEERISLVETAVSPLSFSVSDIEVKRIVDGSTFDTVSYFKNQLGYQEVYICCGYDKLSELEKWNHSEELISENKFLVFTRNGKGLKDCSCSFVLRHKKQFLEVEEKNHYPSVSSTQIRNAYYQNNLYSVKDFIPKGVYVYLSAKVSNFIN